MLDVCLKNQNNVLEVLDWTNHNRYLFLYNNTKYEQLQKKERNGGNLYESQQMW